MFFYGKLYFSGYQKFLYYIIYNELSMIVINIIICSYFPYNFCRTAYGDYIGGNIFGYNRSSTNHRIISNMYSRQNCNIRSSPNIFSNIDRFVITVTLSTKFKGNWMHCSNNGHIRCK